MLRAIARPAIALGLAAALIAAVVWVSARPALVALEWRLHDRWLPAARPAPPSPGVLVIARDPSSEARLGAGRWDRVLAARAIGAVARAGAAVIGTDVAPDEPSPPGRGGAAGDAMLAQAIDLAGNVIAAVSGGAPTTSPSPGQRRAHLAAPPDVDGVARRVPLLAPQLPDAEAPRVPALGLALAAAVRGQAPEDLAATLPVGADGGLLVAFAAPGTVTHVQFAWLQAKAGEEDEIRRVVEGKAVILGLEPPGPALRAPGGAELSRIEVQAQLLNALLAGAVLRELAVPWMWAEVLLLAVALAALMLGLRWPYAMAAAIALAGAHVAVAAAALPLAGVLVPLVPGLLAAALALVGATAWRLLGAVGQVERLEGEMARVQGELATARGALVRHETAVEALEEDLEAARVAVARSAGAEEDLGRAAEALRGQLSEARAQEERTRRRLADLERELNGLRDDRPAPGVFDDAAAAALARECAALGIATRSPALLALFRDLGRAARSTLPILLLGEPGTGKELFARAAHRLSARAGGPFVAVNMAAIPPELFESELFGHVRGSFTGAVADRTGHFEAAHRGTLFLDEIGDLRLDHQAKLLRVLQDGTFHRVGGTRATAVDVRVVAATNRDLDRGVAEGWFRADLFFRLKGVAFRLPPLRERREDVPLLAQRFAGEAAAGLGRDGVSLSGDALLALQEHRWPGNVRELQQCLRQAVAMADGAVIGRADLRLAPAPGAVPVAAAARAAAPDPVAELEPGSDAAVLACLREHRFDMQATARALGWDRSTVTQRLKGMGFRALVQSGGDPAVAARALAGDPDLSAVVETKLREYADHLVRTVSAFPSADAAIAACRRRFKNLPERHFRALETLVRRRFDHRG